MMVMEMEMKMEMWITYMVSCQLTSPVSKYLVLIGSRANSPTVLLV